MEGNNFINDFVYIKNGRYKGRIGYCDDINGPVAFVHFGHALLAPDREIPIGYLSQINTDVLINRHRDIEK